MSTPKHTPGPWTVQDSTDNDDDTTLTIYAPKDEASIAIMDAFENGCECFSEIRANATLIAAAPVMYEALIEAEGMWNIARMIDSKHHAGNPISNELWSDFHQYLMEWHTKRKAALAQAEGVDHE